MLSEAGFKHHLDNIQSQAEWIQYYTGEDKLAEPHRISLENSKQILLSYFKRKEGEK